MSVTGVGSGDAVLASTVSGSGATAVATATPVATTQSSSTLKHVITADYLGTPWGSTSVTPARAAPYLTWGETGIANTNAIAAAGIKTMVYFDANRVQSTDPLYSKLSGTEFATTCSGARISDSWDSVTQYSTNNGSSAMRAAYAAYVASVTAGHTVDAIFEDDSDPLGEFASTFFKPGLPCGYSDATWLANQRTMLGGLNHDTIVNGFSAMSSSVPIATTTQLLSESKTIGGTMESCYTDNGSTPEQDRPGSGSIPKTHRCSVTGENKDFQCWGMDPTAAASAVPSRLYMLASFLLTYSPTYSILREDYATASGVHVMPESQLVPTDPVVATPSTVASLEKSDVYVREYRACYYAGKLIGQCAMVVNNDRVIACPSGVVVDVQTHAHLERRGGPGRRFRRVRRRGSAIELGGTQRVRRAAVTA